MDRNMVDASSGGTLMDKTHSAARSLISNMAANSQQFGVRNLGKTVHEVQIYNVDVTEHLRLENKLNELTSMVRQLAIGQQTTQTQQTQQRLCGICVADHFTDVCPQLQEPAPAGVFQAQSNTSKSQQNQQYNPYSNTYNPGWRDIQI